MSKQRRLSRVTSGVSNLYDTPDTMDEHIMAFPEKLQAITEFEEAAGITGADNIHIEHHEEGHSIQVRFTKDVQSVIEVLRRQGSPSFQRTDQSCMP